MRAEIISIGTEILVGSILNTNARFLSERLAENAVDIYHQTTVGDNPERLIECFSEAAKRCDLIISSGGLGPTEDDITVRVAARFLDQPLKLHQATFDRILKRLKKRNLRMTKLIARQCYIPASAIVIPNQNGTAPGLLCQKKIGARTVWLLLLPGPPRELEPMFLKQALRLLQAKLKFSKDFFEVRSVRIAGLIEVQVAQKVGDLLKMKPPVTVGIYAKPGQVELKIMAKAKSRSHASREADRIEQQIRKRFGTFVYGLNEESLASSVVHALRKENATLSLAESCTGGLTSSLITDVPGSSEVFRGSVIAYANSVKIESLGVPSRMLKRHGAVSRQVAFAMARGIRNSMKTDYGIALTGIAGPTGGSHGKPVGLVYIAIADAQSCKVKRYVFLGERTDIKLRSAETALNDLRLKLMSS